MPYQNGLSISLVDRSDPLSSFPTLYTPSPGLENFVLQYLGLAAVFSLKCSMIQYFPFRNTLLFDFT